MALPTLKINPKEYFLSLVELQEEVEDEEDSGERAARRAGMVLCRECACLRFSACTAAAEGLIQGAAQQYFPVQDIFRRCGEYQQKGA